MMKTVLFDLDGTIIDTNELIIQSFLHVLQGQTPGFLTREHIIPHMGKPLEDQIRSFSGRDQVDDLITAYREYNMKRHDELVREFPYVREVLAMLHQHGIHMGIVTTKMRNTTAMGLKLCGLDKYMEAIVTLEDVKHPKPHPEPVLRAMGLLQAKPDTTIMVGDSPYDIEAANQAGVISVGVAWSLKGANHLRQFRPAHIIHDMRELIKIVGIEGVSL